MARRTGKGMDDLIQLWIELVEDPETSRSGFVSDQGEGQRAASVFDECLESAQSFCIWDSAKDESLKSILSVINRMLNESRTTTKGLTLLNNFVSRIRPSRFITIQDGLTSALHLTVKNLDSELAKQILVHFLPQCQKFPDLNQVVTTTIISKILSHFCEESKHSIMPSTQGIYLLKVCLQKYHGPCGNFRKNLEKILVPIIDDNCKESSKKSMLQVLPLLSAAGGGGTKGDKHGQDWHQMVLKILRVMHDCIRQLFGDACTVSEEENPYSPDTILNLPDIQEENVYIRLTLLKRRLVNLTTALGFYLRIPFLAAKPVPQKGILNIVINMLLLNPIDILKNIGNSSRREFVYLATILPSVHQAAFNLLDSLISCVGENIFTEAVRVEQLFLQELTWMFERSNSFENLKIEVYKAMLRWLKLTKGSITSLKTVTLWMTFLRRDIEIEKEIVELNLLSKRKKGQPKVSSGKTSLASTEAGRVVIKSSTTCRLALEILTMLHSAAESTSHESLYKQVGIIVAEFTQSATNPSPYNDPACRISAYKYLLDLAMNPYAKSPVSISLIVSLVRQGRDDPAQSVVTYCCEVSSLLERLIHPICPSMNFPNISIPVTSDLLTVVPTTNIQELDSASVETSESFCQTENSEYESALNDTLNSSINISSTLELDNLKDTIEQTIQRSLDKMLFHRQLNGIETSISEPERISPAKKIISPFVQSNSTSAISMNGYSSKRKAPTELASTPEKQPTYSKKLKIQGEGAGEEYLEWLKEFVNVGPDD